MSTILSRRLPVEPSLQVVAGRLACVVASGFAVSPRFGTGRNLANVTEQAASSSSPPRRCIDARPS